MLDTNIKIFNFNQLPTVPHTLVKLMDAFRDDETEFNQIADIIQQDPALIASMLKVVNSAAYAPCRFNNFNQILVSLGMDTIKSITTTTAVQQFFSEFNCDDSGQINQLWLSSLRAAFLSKAVATLVGYPHKDEAYLGGLIHQIGQLIILSQYKNDYEQILAQNNTADELHRKERQLTGFTSLELGYQVIKDWNLGSMLDEAILLQEHSVESLSDSPLLIKIINLSHYYSNSQVNKTGDDFYNQAYQLFGLAQGLIDDTVDTIQSDIKQACKSLDIQFDDTIKLEQAILGSNAQDYNLQLAQRVKNLALHSASNNKSETELVTIEQAIHHLMSHIQIIFGLPNSLFFVLEQNHLVYLAQNMGSEIELTSLKIELKNDNNKMASLVALAQSKRSITSSLEQTNTTMLATIDQQLIRLLKTDGMLCIPLFSKHRFYGILTTGVNKSQYQSLLQQRLLLGDFTRSAARNLDHIYQLKKQIKEGLDSSNQEHKLYIRKMVHEANNPLTIINNYLQVLSIKMQKSDSKLACQIVTVQDEIRRVADILIQMKDLPEATSLQSDESNSKTNDKNNSDAKKLKNKTNINELINNLVVLFKESLFKLSDVEEIRYLDDSIPELLSDKNGLKQVFINLIKNAIEEMPSGGELEIKTNDLVNFSGKQYVEVTISDTGPGMSKELLAKIFSPIKTNKSGEHSGLGLSICKNIMDRMGGQISCYNRSGLGLSFVILIPRIIDEESY